MLTTNPNLHGAQNPYNPLAAFPGLPGFASSSTMGVTPFPTQAQSNVYQHSTPFPTQSYSTPTLPSFPTQQPIHSFPSSQQSSFSSPSPQQQQQQQVGFPSQSFSAPGFPPAPGFPSMAFGGNMQAGVYMQQSFPFYHVSKLEFMKPRFVNRGFNNICVARISQLPIQNGVMAEIESVQLNGNVQLMPHQVRALHHIEKQRLAGSGTILAAEMGLGKTLTALMYAALTKHLGTTLIVTKLNLIESVWTGQITRFFGDYFGLKVLVVHDNHKPEGYGTDSSWKAFLRSGLSGENFDEANVVLTSYEVINKSFDICQGSMTDPLTSWTTTNSRGGISDWKNPGDAYIQLGTTGYGNFHNYPWFSIFSDESHEIRNIDNKSPKAMITLPISSIGTRVAMTGTPYNNDDSDLFSQMLFACYKGPITKASKWNYQQILVAPGFDIFLPMTLKSEGIELPPKHERVVKIEADRVTKMVYIHYLRMLQSSLDVFLAGGNEYGDVLKVLTALRQVVISPHLITELSSNYKKPKCRQDGYVPTCLLSSAIESVRELDTVVHDINVAGFGAEKIRILCCEINNILNDNDRIVRKGLGKKHQIFICTSYTCALYIIAEALNKMYPERKNLYAMVTGKVSMKDRKVIFKAFQEGQIDILMGNYKICSMGLDLSTADYVFPLEPWWTFAVPEQAIRRAWRLGQTGSVNVIWLVVAGTLEEYILELANKKKEKSKDYEEKKDISQRGEIVKPKLERSDLIEMMERAWASDIANMYAPVRPTVIPSPSIAAGTYNLSLSSSSSSSSSSPFSITPSASPSPSPFTPTPSQPYAPIVPGAFNPSPPQAPSQKPLPFPVQNPTPFLGHKPSLPSGATSGSATSKPLFVPSSFVSKPQAPPTNFPQFAPPAPQPMANPFATPVSNPFSTPLPFPQSQPFVSQPPLQAPKPVSGIDLGQFQTAIGSLSM